MTIDLEWAAFMESVRADSEYIKHVSHTAEALFVALYADSQSAPSTYMTSTALLASLAFEAAEEFHAERRAWANAYTDGEARKRAERRAKEQEGEGK